MEVQSPGAPLFGIQPASAAARAESAQARARVVSTEASSSRIAAASPGSLRRAGEGRRLASRTTGSFAFFAAFGPLLSAVSATASEAWS